MPDVGQFADASAASTIWTAPLTSGEITLTLTVTDLGGNTDTRSFTISVSSAEPPIANAGPNQSVARGAEVTLDGNGSSDPDGEAENLTYLWMQTGRIPAGEEAISLTGVRPTFTVPADTSLSELTFSLTVTDEQMLSSAPDTVSIRIRPLFQEIVANQTYTVGMTIDDLVLPAALGRGQTYALAPVPDGLSFEPGTRTLSGTPTVVDVSDMIYTVTDRGGRTDTLSFTITVLAPNQAPTTDGAAITTAEDTPRQPSPSPPRMTRRRSRARRQSRWLRVRPTASCPRARILTATP